jgi:hypothetical protein
MKKQLFIGFLSAAVVLVILLQVSIFKSVSQPQESELVKAAQNFLNVLDDQQKPKATYPLNSDERFTFVYVPKDDRNGLQLNEMNEAQRNAAKALIQASLSKQGYEKATNVMELEGVLKVIEGRGADDNYRDPNKYFFTIFGEPTKDGAWGWRLEGHHLSMHFSALSEQLVSGTPAFFGANPAKVPSGPKKGWRILQMEEDLGRELVQSLSDAQLKTAVVAEEAYPEILTGTDRQAEKTPVEGIPYGDMNAEQQQMLMQLLEVYYNNYKPEFANNLMDRIKKAGLEQIHFAWAGGTEPGEKHYYRLQNPIFVIEYDNTQNDGNHIHTVVRDLENDFGVDVLKKHYQEAHN